MIVWNKWISGIGAAAAMVVAVGCGSGGGGTYQPKQVKAPEKATVVAGQEAKLFPLRKGNSWTYVGEALQRAGNQTRTAPFEFTLRVANVETDANGNTNADIEVVVDGKVTERQQWRTNSRGIYQVSAGNERVPFAPPQPAILFPIDMNRTFEWQGRGMSPAGQVSYFSSTSRVLAPQEVDTQAGRYSAIPVESRGQISQGDQSGQYATTAFWSPNVGLVRFRQEVVIGNTAQVQVLRLKQAVVQ